LSSSKQLTRSLVIGLSGGIGSGKTVVSNHFARLGIDIIDTDIIARQIVEPKTLTLLELARKFGQDILTPDGELNRAVLRQRAFSNTENKKALDQITHPAIYRASIEQIKQAQSPYCLVVVPLLTRESAFTSLMDRVLAVNAEFETKISRVKERSQLSREEVINIMKTQLNDDQRNEFSDDVIENNSTLEPPFTTKSAIETNNLLMRDQSNKVK